MPSNKRNIRVWSSTNLDTFPSLRTLPVLLSKFYPYHLTTLTRSLQIMLRFELENNLLWAQAPAQCPNHSRSPASWLKPRLSDQRFHIHRATSLSSMYGSAFGHAAQRKPWYFCLLGKSRLCLVKGAFLWFPALLHRYSLESRSWQRPVMEVQMKGGESSPGKNPIQIYPANLWPAASIAHNSGVISRHSPA